MILDSPRVNLTPAQMGIVMSRGGETEYLGNPLGASSVDNRRTDLRHSLAAIGFPRELLDRRCDPLLGRLYSPSHCSHRSCGGKPVAQLQLMVDRLANRQ